MWMGIYLSQTHGYPHLMKKRLIIISKCSLEKLENVFGLSAHLPLNINV